MLTSLSPLIQMLRDLFRSRFGEPLEFLLLAHGRRRVIHFSVTANPTAVRTAQQIVEAFPWQDPPKYLLRDRDKIYGRAFQKRVRGVRLGNSGFRDGQVGEEDGQAVGAVVIGHLGRTTGCYGPTTLPATRATRATGQTPSINRAALRVNWRPWLAAAHAAR